MALGCLGLTVKASICSVTGVPLVPWCLGRVARLDGELTGVDPPWDLGRDATRPGRQIRSALDNFRQGTRPGNHTNQTTLFSHVGCTVRYLAVGILDWHAPDPISGCGTGSKAP